jgi:pimeloyl-ACP methyl ester carboxylesterase
MSEVTIPVTGAPRPLPGLLDVAAGAQGLIVFAHGSGSSRLSRRNQAVAADLRAAGFGTLLFDLLDPAEAAHRQNVFDIPLLGSRVSAAVDWLRDRDDLTDMPLGLFGASTGAAAALVCAAERPREIGAVVSRGGRPDLAGKLLSAVRCPTLLIVGGADTEVLALNRQALEKLTCEKSLEVVPGATHLFEEEGALDAVTGHAITWFRQALPRAAESG